MVPVYVLYFPELRDDLMDIMVDYIHVARPDGLYLNDWEQCLF